MYIRHIGPSYKESPKVFFFMSAHIWHASSHLIALNFALGEQRSLIEIECELLMMHEFNQVQLGATLSIT